MRLVIVSNRLHVTVTETDGKVSVNPSSGGLATGIRSYLDTLKEGEYLWIGWPGNSKYSDPNGVETMLINQYHSRPVFVDEQKMDLFYNGFCNKTIWPLFHYFPYITEYDEKMWAEYREVNTLFAEAVLDILQPDDIVWVHDYHLMLVPKLVRDKQPDAAIGFFLHIPFPSYELFRLLPRRWGQEILSGLLASDLIGFHTYDYTQYFLRCVLRILGLHHDMGLIPLEHNLSMAGTFPMGIDYDRYHNAVNSAGVRKEKSELTEGLKNQKVIFSVDRQDYTKGILKRLEGFDQFLKTNPSWHQKVVLIMVIVPSRIGVDQYQKEKDEINRLIAKINGDYGNINWTPVIYQYKAIPFDQLIALYNVSDAGLVTPLRDGMNLVAKEYVATQTGRNGVLILSEMAGAAMELGEAVIINPNNREEIAEAIKTALEMPADEKERRLSAMQDRLKKHDINRWVSGFLAELEKTKEEQKLYGTQILKGPALDGMLERYRDAERRTLFLDYDGTLVPFEKHPRLAVPSRELLHILRLITEHPLTELVIISGRNRKDLDAWYGRLPITLAAEHGVWFKKPGDRWKLSRPLNNDWKPRILPILKNYRDRLPGSFIEEKEYGLVWHFRNSDAAQSGLRVKEFVDDMVQFTARNEIEVLMGDKVAELKCSGVGKGETARQILSERPSDFILAAGDDRTDETLFRALPKGAFTIKVGKQKSFADYHVDGSRDMMEILGLLAGYRKGLIRTLFGYLFRRK